MATNELFTLEQAKTLLRVQAGLARDAAQPKCVTTLADLSSWFEEESKRTLARAKFEDEIFELLLQHEPKLKPTGKPGRPSKGVRQAREAALSALRRKAMCIADTVTRAEEQALREAKDLVTP